MASPHCTTRTAIIATTQRPKALPVRTLLAEACGGIFPKIFPSEEILHWTVRLWTKKKMENSIRGKSINSYETAEEKIFWARRNLRGRQKATLLSYSMLIELFRCFDKIHFFPVQLICFSAINKAINRFMIIIAIIIAWVDEARERRLSAFQQKSDLKLKYSRRGRLYSEQEWRTMDSGGGLKWYFN